MINKRGITLISLVITIILLIILAGISINLSLGENGIINKAKLAKENYSISANEEMEMLQNFDKQIVSNRDNNEESGQYFYTSFNGFKSKLGTGKLNSLFGLTGETYEQVSGEDWNVCIYEKKLQNQFDLSGEFEISVKLRLETNLYTQMGVCAITFQKSDNTNNADENVIGIGMSDAWGRKYCYTNIYIIWRRNRI